MFTSNTFLIAFTAITFIIYGVLCLSLGHMSAEFKRYKLQRFRKTVGFFEVLGGLGLLVGLQFNYILQASSLGLIILMFLGVGVRVKIKDPILQILPAFTLMVINMYIFRLSLASQ